MLAGLINGEIHLTDVINKKVLHVYKNGDQKIMSLNRLNVYSKNHNDMNENEKIIDQHESKVLKDTVKSLIDKDIPDVFKNIQNDDHMQFEGNLDDLKNDHYYGYDGDDDFSEDELSFGFTKKRKMDKNEHSEVKNSSFEDNLNSLE